MIDQHARRALQAKERSQLEAQLAEAEQRLEAVQKERAEQEEHLSAATDRVEGAPVSGGALTWLGSHALCGDWLVVGRMLCCAPCKMRTVRNACRLTSQTMAFSVVREQVVSPSSGRPTCRALHDWHCCAEKTAEAEAAIQEATRKRNELLVREDAARVAASEAAGAINEAQVGGMTIRRLVLYRKYYMQCACIFVQTCLPTASPLGGV